ncbi:unnamed protein product, partial [Ectocarpus sp. 12 AP-2014]
LGSATAGWALTRSLVFETPHRTGVGARRQQCWMASSASLTCSACSSCVRCGPCSDLAARTDPENASSGSHREMLIARCLVRRTGRTSSTVGRSQTCLSCCSGGVCR